MNLAGAAGRAQQVPGPTCHSQLPLLAQMEQQQLPGKTGGGGGKSPFGCESRGVVQLFPQNKNSISKCIRRSSGTTDPWMGSALGIVPALERAAVIVSSVAVSTEHSFPAAPAWIWIPLE